MNGENINQNTISKNHSRTNSSVYNPQLDTKIQIFQPKLLKMKNPVQINAHNEMVKTFKEENKRIKDRIRKIQKLDRQMKLDEDGKNDTIVKGKIVSFYKNPFVYMDYLIEKYCNYKKNNF